MSLCLAALTGTFQAQYAAADSKEKDLHYNEVGFYDIHVCNWPDRKPFFMPLFSSTRYDEISRIEILNPDDSLMTELDLGRYKTIHKKGKPEKHVFIQQLDIPAGAENGWYKARIVMKDGEVHTASDYVDIDMLDRAGGHVPGDGEDVMEPPSQLRWSPVPEAGFYQVFIRDLWDDDRLIHTSKLLDKPVLDLPPGMLETGGYYSWVIHARDVNEDIRLGDFNKGSLSKPATFTIGAGK